MLRPHPACVLPLLLATLLPAALASAAPARPLPLQPAQIKAMALGFTPAVDSAWIPVARIPGEVELAADAQSSVVAAYPGTLTAVHAAEGSQVNSGSPLLSVASPAWAAALAEAHARGARRQAAQQQATRAQALLRAGVIAAREAETLQAEASALAAASQADHAVTAHATLAADGSVLVRAPRAGRLLQRASGQGRAIQPGELLARIGLRDERVVIGKAPARLAGQLAAGMRARVGGAVGKVESVAAAIDPGSRSISVSASLPAAAGLPGALVELAIERAAPAGTRRVPAGAVIGINDGQVVFVHRGETISLVPVQVHYRDGQHAWLGGVPAGASVVSRGVLALKAVAQSLPANGG